LKQLQLDKVILAEFFPLVFFLNEAVNSLYLFPWHFCNVLRCVILSHRLFKVFNVALFTLINKKVGELLKLFFLLERILVRFVLHLELSILLAVVESVKLLLFSVGESRLYKPL
jgi:hypothetical protein